MPFAAASTSAIFEWDASNAILDSIADVSAAETSVRGVCLSPDGSRLFFTGLTSGLVHGGTLSTPWDLTTLGSLASVDVSAQVNNGASVQVSEDGTRMFVCDGNPDRMGQYALSPAWDITSATFSASYDATGFAAITAGAYVSPDGTNMYLADSSQKTIFRVPLATPFTFSSAGTVTSLDVSADALVTTGVFVSPDGRFLVVLDGLNDALVLRYRLATPWDVTSATLLGVGDLPTNDGRGLWFGAGGMRLFIANNTEDEIRGYVLT